MESEEPDNLLPNARFREQEVLTKFSILLREEHSRYEEQAEKLLANEFLISKSGIYEFSYLVQIDRFLCKATPKSPLAQSFSIEVPIPNTQEEKIEILIELFAQSEAGLI